MKTRINFKITALFTVLFLLGCDVNAPLSLVFEPPRCSIRSIEQEDHTPGHFARYYIIVSNDGEPAAFNVGCIIKLKYGNLIVDRGSAYFGTLQPGESALDDAVFTDIETHDDYSYSEILLYWYDASGDYYEKNY